jgi:hypothetical protein
MEVRNQERDIVTLNNQHHCFTLLMRTTHLNRLPPQHKESLRPLRQEPRKLMHQDMLNLVRLLDLDADAHTVDARFDEDTLVFVSRHGKGVEEDFGRRPCFYLWDIVSLGGL